MANEKRLISVDDCPCDGCPAKPCGHPARCVKFNLWLNKTVDAVEVVHSSWILNNDGSGTCKNCHRTTKDCWDYDRWMNYCPNCGADMRGSEE